MSDFAQILSDINEQAAVQMVDFMLQAASEQSCCRDTVIFALAVQVFYADFGGAFHIAVNLRHAQAAFRVGLCAINADDFRIDE